MNKFNRILSAALAAALTAGCVTIIGAADVSFTDVNGHWAWTNGQIPYLVEKNVLNGYKQDNGTYIFKPDGEVKRSEFIKMLDEVFGLTATAKISYTDMNENDWYYQYYQKAAAQGYILNYGTSGYPNGYITREEATALLVRYLSLPANEIASASTFDDYDSISFNFRNYVLQAVDAGIINGYVESTGTYFKPQKTLSRAEALTILYKAAGCIYDKTVSSRESGAHSENNTITDGGITISNVDFTGRNIITEGASGGKITFSDCEFDDVLYIRGSADVTFVDCEVGEVYASGGGTVSLAEGTEVGHLILEKTATVNVYSGTEIEILDVRSGSDNVKVSGDGKLGKVYVDADNFYSSMVPAEYEIGNNLTASFGGTSYSGASDEQNSFNLNPFASVKGSDYYINTVMYAGGRLYYYYTDLATSPTVSSYDSYYNSATYGSYVEVSAGEAVSHATFSSSNVGTYRYVVLQLVDGNRKYAPVVVSNSVVTETGFSTAPYLADSTTIKFKSQYSGTLYWFYTDNGNNLTQLEFLTQYAAKEKALKGENSVTSLKSFSCELKSAYLENYSHVAFMIIGNDGKYYSPVTVTVGDTGFSTLPAVTTPGTVKFKTSVSGTVYYYLSEEDEIPTSDKYNSEYKAADSDLKKKLDVTKGKETTMNYDINEAEDNPYMIIAIKNSDGEWMQPVVIEVNFSTGFRNEPEIKNESEITYRAKQNGSIKWYYTTEETSPTSEEFNNNWDSAKSKYKGQDTSISTTYETIEYTASYTTQYPYMAIMLTDKSGNDFCPVVLELDITSQTGFDTLPYVEDGKVYFKTDASVDVYYYYSKSSSSVSPDDFYDNYRDAGSGKRDVVSSSSFSTKSIEIDADLYASGYDNIVFAVCVDEDANEFAFPYVLNLEEGIIMTSSTGIDISILSTKVKVTALADGKLYWYTTNNANKIADTSSDFQSRYSSANSDDKGAYSVDKDETKTFNFNSLGEYLVLCFYYDGEYLKPVCVSNEDGVISGDDNENEENSDGSTVSGTGLSYTDYDIAENTVSVTSKHNGTVVIYQYIGKTKVALASASVTANVKQSIYVSGLENLGNSILSTTVYVQLTDTNGNVYQAYTLIQ